MSQERDRVEQSPETLDRYEGEVRLRQAERASTTTPERVPDRSFTDTAGRPITIQNSESGNIFYAEAKDTSKGPSERVGTITASLNRDDSANPRLRITMVDVRPSYQGAGIGGELIQRAEDYAQRQGVREIYGVVAENEARSFWASQSDHGWELVNNGTEVRKQL